MRKFLSVVIPAYNEEKRIVSTLFGIIRYLTDAKYDFEVIVVDDGSEDLTVKVIETGFQTEINSGLLKIIKSEKNAGKGNAVRRGVLSANSEYIYFTDADLSTPPEEIDNFVAKLRNGGYDVVIGSRSIKGANVMVRQPFYRELMGKTFNKIVRFFLLNGFIDTQCGAKMFRHEAAKKIFSAQKLDGFAFDVEALYLAKKFNLKILEMPVRWINSDASRVRMISDSMGMFLDVLKIRALHR